jgi:hypothetical protein
MSKYVTDVILTSSYVRIYNGNSFDEALEAAQDHGYGEMARKVKIVCQQRDLEPEVLAVFDRDGNTLEI